MKNDPTGQQHELVTKTKNQPSSKSKLKHEMSEAMPSGNVELKTPSGLLSGLRGVLADRPSNQSNSRSVGSGSAGTRTQSMRSGVDEGEKYLYPTSSNTTVSSDPDNENYGSMSTNNIRHGKGPKQSAAHKYE